MDGICDNKIDKEDKTHKNQRNEIITKINRQRVRQLYRTYTPIR